MKPKNTQLFAKTHRDLAGIGEFDLNEPRLAYFDKVSYSGIVHGDHHSPNQFEYFVEEGKGPSGFEYDNDYDSDSNLTYYVHDSGYLPYGQRTAEAAFADFHNSMTDYVYNEALSRLYDQMRGGLDLSIDGFQYKQNKGLLGSTTKLLSFAGSIPIVKRVSSAWLSYQYGWKPIVQDIYGIADESLRFHINKIQKYKGSARWKLPDVVRSVSRVAGGTYGGANIERYAGSFVGVKFGVAMNVNNGFDLARWTSLNPASIGWELLPYSFVVDWFYDVGGMLRSAETAFLYNQNFSSGYQDLIKVHNYSSVDSGGRVVVYADKSRQEKAWSFSDWSKGTYFRRFVLGGLPFPVRPTLHASLGSERLLNAAGLLGNLLGRK